MPNLLLTFNPLSMNAIILKCKPYSSFHFGQVAVDADTSLNDTSAFLHSDTLFSALINLAARVYPDAIETILELFGHNTATPKVRLSSGFYCLQKGADEVYFLPRPLSSQFKTRTNHKDLKEIQFISKGLWEQGINADDWFDAAKCCIVQKKFAMTKAEYAAFNLTEKSEIYKTISMPKVALHKDTKKDSFYHQTNIQLGDLGETQIHFYFLVERSSELTAEETQKINVLFNMLPHVGIGGERTTGCGLFEDVEERSFILNTDINCQVTVSLTNPKDLTEFKTFTQYQIVQRGGRQTGADGTLKKVLMITEGSVAKSPVNGRIVDIALLTKNPYLRNGIGFTLPYSVLTI